MKKTAITLFVCSIIVLSVSACDCVDDPVYTDFMNLLSEGALNDAHAMLVHELAEHPASPLTHILRGEFYFYLAYNKSDLSEDDFNNFVYATGNAPSSVKAENAFRQAFEIDPDCLCACQSLVQILEDNQQYDEITADFKQ